MTVQLPFPEMLPESDWRMPNDFPDIRGRGAKFIGFDVETYDPHLREKGPGFIRGESFVAGYSIYTDQVHRYYPIRHGQGQNLPPNIVNEYIADQLSGNEPKITANGLYDLQALYFENVRNVGGKIYDIQIAEPLLDEETSLGYSLDALAKKYLGEGKDEDLLNQAAALYSKGGRKNGRGNQSFSAKGDLWLMPAKFVAPYALADSKLTVKVFEKQEALIDQEDLRGVFEMETSLIPILLQMRVRGIRVDMEGAHKLAAEITRSIDELSMKIKRLVDIDVNIDSGQQLLRAYEAYNRGSVNKVEIKYTAIGNPSFNKEWLHSQSDPLSELILKKRKLMTLRDDFIVGDILGEQINGRVHAQFHQLRQDDRGTRSGRFSSTNPNLTQVPTRDEECTCDKNPVSCTSDHWPKKIRSLFLANEGEQCLKSDFSGQEPRLLVHFAHACNFPGTAEAVHAFCSDRSTDYHTLTTKIVNEKSGRSFTRKQIKGINLGILYGMGLKKLCRMLNVSDQEGKEILAAYHEAIPFVKALSSKAMSVAAERGFVKTILGRKRRFNLWEPIPESEAERANKHIGLPLEQAEKKWPNRRLQRSGVHKACNAIIQGSAADQTKKAMQVMYYEFGKVPSLVVHDELVASVVNMDEARLYKQVMETAVMLSIPVIADAGLGPNWGNTKEKVQ